MVDDQTGRGVPLVELRTVNDLRFWTDSQGIVAFDEPGLLGHEVYFHVRSHGYEHPQDGFGFRGKALATKAGGQATLRIRRRNIAERLYRVTGAGIYAESVKAGLKTPLRLPVLNGQVLGSDTVLNFPFRGKLFWVWGDTNRPQYPLGNFQTPAGTSELPQQGGLDPEIGVDLTYYVDDKGFARGMCAMPGSGPTWVESLVALREGDRERLFAGYVKVKPPLEIYAHGLAEYQPDAERFETQATFDEKAPLFPSGHALLHSEGAVQYVYFAKPFPQVRVRATPADLKDLTRYQGYTCLEEGARLEPRGTPRWARAESNGKPSGRASFAWRTNTAILRPEVEARLVRDGQLAPHDAMTPVRSTTDGKPVQPHYGSTSWNAWRGRWISIFVEQGGSSSLLGEVWYAEADQLTGPWCYAVKIATHDKYTFYNPKHHPWFDKHEGRVIFFEGTYTHTFSGNPEQTPRYDYNQMMYKLDLADPRLAIPAPVYALEAADGKTTLAMRGGLPKEARAEVDSSPFYAIDRPIPGSVPVFFDPPRGGWKTGEPWKAGASADRAPDPEAAFYALPASSPASPITALAYEYTTDAGTRVLALEGRGPAGSKRSEHPLFRAWLNARLPR